MAAVTHKVFIPIKKRSKGVSDKNFLELDGIPLWRRSLLKLKDFQVYVDTDSEELQALIPQDSALAHVTVYPRDTRFCGHHVSVNDLIQNFLDRFNIQYEPIAQIHVTHPFLRAETIEEAFEYMRFSSDYDSVAGCTALKKRLWREESYGLTPVNHNPMNLQPTAELTPLYEENSTLYLFSAEVFRKIRNRIGFRPHFMKVSFPENLEVSTPEEWQLCQMVHTSIRSL
jgi:CMP-N-acetylneuraminic acid synthetase